MYMYIVHVYTCTCSFVLDGWPLTKSHVDLLTKFKIIPVLVIELQISDEEMMRRAHLDRNSPTRQILQCTSALHAFLLFEHFVLLILFVCS